MNGKSVSLLKALTREQLLGNYPKLSVYVALYILIYFTLSELLLMIKVTGFTVSVLVSLVQALLIDIFTVGFVRICMRLIRGQEINIKEFFYVLKHDPDKVIILAFVMWVFSTLIQLPILLPDSVAETLGLGRGAFVFAKCVLVSAFLIVYIYAYILLSQCYYLYLDRPECSVKEMMLLSISVMNHHKGRFFYLMFNVFGMACLVILTFGIGIFWMLPNMNVLMINFYEDIKAEFDDVTLR
ncbi:MAG: DUF975 family protein [Lachnospiraceae bacterium]|nr:DUF975 family protein [Lachnospiraceae bacterium]